MSQGLWAISSWEPLKSTEIGICSLQKLKSELLSSLYCNQYFFGILISIKSNKFALILEDCFTCSIFTWLLVSRANMRSVGSYYALEALRQVEERKLFLSINEKFLQMGSPCAYSRSLLYSGTGLCYYSRDHFPPCGRKYIFSAIKCT